MPTGNLKDRRHQASESRSLLGRGDGSRTNLQAVAAVINDWQRGSPQIEAQTQIFAFRAIGHIESIDGNDASTDTIKEEGLIVLQPEYAGGLDGFAPGDRMTVIFVFDRARDFELRQHPRGDLQRPRRGVFNLCSPHRPNPIGMTGVEILEIEGNIVRVRGLDAWPGTPILDLKPEKGGKR